MLIVDEFGKSLEAFRDDGDSDPYLLQQLAEAGQSQGGLPIFLLTLQHLSFEDYLGGTNVTQRREWAKVQGRFEDIAYVESPAQTRALIRTVFTINDAELRNRIHRWSEMLAKDMKPLGVRDLATPEGIASCYPLHPIAALVVPELCNRFGQHERTLFSFLAGPDRSSVLSSLASRRVDPHEHLPSIGLETVYDYFVSNGIVEQQSSRWTEISVRIRDSHGLTPAQERLLKGIALLNLVSSSGTIRASRQVLEVSYNNVGVTLDELEARGIVTYRDFADEYRIWQGTDVDIGRILNLSRHITGRSTLVEILSEIGEPSPVVAARHSAEKQTLRVFKRRYASGADVVEPPDAFSDYDGEVLLIVDKQSELPTLAHADGHLAKPVVTVVPSHLSALASAAKEVAAVNMALQDPMVAGDWVARQELGERLAQSRAMLDAALADTFAPNTSRWLLLLGDQRSAELFGGRGSAALSQAADKAYPGTPEVRNEMLNRTSLTSQGAKARRVLLEAMINHGEKTNLGLSGYGPEMAMYRAFLKYTELHGLDTRNQTMTFRSPSHKSPVRPAWDVLMTEFTRAKTRRINLRDVYKVLLSPPVGMKAAVLPVFVTTGLLVDADKIAIYEHGTFKPLLTSELSQRMVRNPAHFEIKHFANTTGARRHAIGAFATHLHIKPRFRKHRVSNVLAVVGHLLARVRQLDNYTRRTDNLTSPARAARDALLVAVEPDDLLFTKLPEALGFTPVPADADTYRDAHDYAQAVVEVIKELESAYSNLLDRLLQSLLTIAAEKTRSAIAGQAKALSGEVLDPNVRAFVLRLANTHIESDTDWIKAVATVVLQKAPAEWRDEDLRRFEHELPQQVASFRRLVALHAQHRADGGGPFEAFRVTFTRPDGREDARLVSVDHDERDKLNSALDKFIQQITDVTGTPQRAQDALLALLGERLLPSMTIDEESTGEAPNLWVQHG